MAVSDYNLSGIAALAKQLPLSANAASKAVQPPSEASNQAPLSQEAEHFVGDRLSLQFKLKSGQSVDVQIARGASGALRQAEFSVTGAVSAQVDERIEGILQTMWQDLDGLFSGDDGSDNHFRFAQDNAISRLDLTVQLQHNDQRQQLEFKADQFSHAHKQVSARWIQSDLNNGDQQQHDFQLTRSGRDDQAKGLTQGQDYGWALGQIDTALHIMDESGQGNKNKLASFFASGLHALFAPSLQLHQELQSMGASAETSRQLVKQTLHGLAGQKTAAGAGPDFQGKFASSAKGHSDYHLALSIQQLSHSSAVVAQGNESSAVQTQTRSLSLDYESNGTRHSYEHSWQRDEQFRRVLENGQLAYSSYRLLDKMQTQVSDGQGRTLESSDYLERRFNPYGQGEARAYQEQSHSVRHIV